MGCCLSSDEEKQDRAVGSEISKDKGQDRQVKKLLLLGAGASGKTTFFKQLKCLHGDGFNPNDRRDFQRQIDFQIIECMQNLIMSARELFEKSPQEYAELELSDEKVVESCAVIEDLRRDAHLNREIAEYITCLWRYPAIQKMFDLRGKFAIPDSCEHFFNSIARISAPEYEPTDEDILLVRKRTTGIIEDEFVIQSTRFHIFDVGGQRNERKKWIHCFDKVTALIFVASLSCYDEYLLEDETKLAMHETLTLFEEVANSRWFIDTPMILFLNKRDLFELKIQKSSMQICFPEYNGFPEYSPALRFIKEAFLSRVKGKEVYVHETCATDRDNVRKVFDDVQHMIIQSGLSKGGLLNY